MQGTPLSTEQVARLLQVTETTVKRWADDGTIRCVKTPGGHRKYFLPDLVRFSEEHSMPMTGLLAGSGSKDPGITAAVATRNTAPIAEAVRSAALEGDRGRLSELFLLLTRNRFPFTAIVDDVIRPALVSVGDAWEAGKLDVHQEHRASETILESMVNLFRESHGKAKRALTAVCAGAEGDLHEIGIRSMAYALELEGWKVVYLGPNTPFQSITALLKSEPPDLLCLSVSAPLRSRAVERKVSMLGSTARSAGTTYVVGGSAFPDERPERLRCDHVARSIGEAVEYIRQAFHLVPGPRRRPRS